MKRLLFPILLFVACGLTWYLARLPMSEADRLYEKLRTEFGGTQNEVNNAVMQVYLLGTVATEEFEAGRLTPDMIRNIEAESDAALEMIGKQNDLAAECLLGVLKILEKKDEEAAKRALVKLIETNSIPPLASDEIVAEVAEYSKTSPAFAEYGRSAEEEKE